MPSPLKLPQDLDAERDIIAAAILDEECRGIACDSLAPSGADFYGAHHESVWGVIASQVRLGAAVDTAAISVRLKELGKGSAIDALLEATGRLPRFTLIDSYCKRVRDLSAMRSVVTLCQQLQAEACSSPEDAGAFLDRAEGAVSAATEGRYEDGEMYTAGDCMEEVFAAMTARAERGGGPEGHTTGLVDLDKKISGLGAGKLIVVGGRPGMGKSALAKEMALGVAQQGLPVAVFSLEMPRVEWFERVLSSESGVKYEEIRTSTMHRGDWSPMMEAAGRICDMPLHISDRGAVTIEYVARWSRRIKRKHGGKLGLVVVDYMQLMGSAARHSSREQEVGAQSRKLKALAKDLGCPVVALAQLNRKLEDRPNKRPKPADLRESGSIEQDADVIMFTYRDAVYNPETEEPNVIEVCVEKQRGGATGVVKLAWNGPLMRVSNLEVRHG